MAEKMLVIGDVAIEMIMDLKRMPAPGEVTEEDSYLFLPGGPAGNAALAATYFGASVSLCSRVGKDGNAARLTRFFTDNGVNVDAVLTESSSQTAITASFRESAYGEPRVVRYRGACAKLSASDVDAALKANPDMVFISPETDGYIAVHTVEACEALRIPVFLDASDRRLLRSLSTKGAKVKALYTTDKEAESFTEMPARDVGSALKCCLSMGQRISADFYVIRLKNRGLFLYDGKTYNIVIASDATEAVPKNGFADVESAILATEYMLHGNPYNACGIAAVADLLSREGKGFRIPNREEVSKHIRKYGLPFN